MLTLAHSVHSDRRNRKAFSISTYLSIYIIDFSLLQLSTLKNNWTSSFWSALWGFTSSNLRKYSIKITSRHPNLLGVWHQGIPDYELIMYMALILQNESNQILKLALYTTYRRQYKDKRQNMKKLDFKLKKVLRGKSRK